MIAAAPKGGSTSGTKGGSTGGGRTNVISGNTTDSQVSPDTKPSTDFYTDMQDYSWANDAVNTLTKRKIINGTGNGLFNPGGLITREEFVKMLVLATQKYDSAAKCTFADVPEDA